MASKKTTNSITTTLDFNTHLKDSGANFWFWDLKKNVMSWSKGSLDLFERSAHAENMLDLFRKHLLPEDEKNLMSNLKEVTRGSQVNFQIINQIKTAKKNVRWIEINGEIIREGKEAIALLGACHDVTRLIQTQKEVKTIHRKAKIGFWHWTPERGTYWSKAIREMAEISENDSPPAFGDWIRNYVHIDDRDRTREEFKQGILSKKPFESVHRQVSFKGNEKIVRSIIMPSPIQKNKIIGTFQDITKEVRLQKEISEQSNLFDDILQTMIVGVAKVSMDGIITFANEAALGYLEDRKMVGRFHMSRNIQQLDEEGNVINPERMPLSRTLKTGESVRLFIHGLTINKRLKWFSVNSAPLMRNGEQIGAIANFVEITEEVEARQNLKKSEKRYRLIAENTGDIITLLNLDGEYEYISPNVFEIRGYTQDEILKHHMSDFFHQDDLAKIEIFQKKVWNGESEILQHRIRHKNGEYKWYESHIHPIFDESNKLQYVHNTVRLIHDQKIAEDKLIESEARFRQLIDEAPFSIEIFDKEGTLIISNKGREKLMGLKSGKGIGWYNIFKDSNVRNSPYAKYIKEAFEAGRGEFTVSEFVPGPVQKYPQHLNTKFFPLHDSSGEFTNAVFFNEDVTEKVNAAKNLKNSEEKFKALAENLPGLIYLVTNDDKFRITYVNEEVKRLTGYTKKAFLNNQVSLNSLVHPDDLAINLEKQRQAVKKGESFSLEYRLQKKSKKWIWVKDTGAGVIDENGNLKFVEGYIEDITESKNLHEETRLNERKFRSLFSDAGHGIGITDSKGLLLDVNKKFIDIIGYSKEELVGKKNFLDLTHSEDLEIGHGQLEKMIRGKISSYQVEKRYVTKSKNVVHFRLNISHFTDPGTGELRIIGTTDDITESVLATEKVRLNERKFRSLFENAGSAIIIADTKGQIIEVNRQAEQLLGFSKSEMEQVLTLQAITHEDYLSLNEEINQKFSKRKVKATTIESRYITKSQVSFWAQENISSYVNETTGETMIVRVIEDITERRAFIKEIQANELRFRSVFEEAGHGVVIADQNGFLTTTNKKFRRILGISKKDIESKMTALDFSHPDYIQETRDQFEHLINNPKAAVQSEVKYITKKGKSIWVRLNSSTYLDPITNEMRIVGIIEDISQRVDALENLKTSEVFQNETINALSMALMVMKTNGQIEQTNLIWDQEIPDTALANAKKGNNFLEVIKKLTLSSRIERGLAGIREDKTKLFEMELYLNSIGKWFGLRASKLKPEFNSLVITLQDITVRKQVERALEESLTKYRNIYNMTPVMMHSIDKQGILLSVSDFWLEKLEYDRHEVIGRNINDFLSEDTKQDAEIVLPVFFQKGSIFDVSYNFITKSGEVVETLLSAIEEGKGTTSARSLAVVTDVTALKQAERQLRKNRRELEEAQHIAKLGNYEFNFKSKTLSSSKMFDNILELDESSPRKLDFLRHVTPEGEQKEVSSIFQSSLKKGDFFEQTLQAVTLKSKKIIWLEILGKTVREKGVPTKLVGTIQDVTKSKTAELEIQKLSERLTLATQAARIGVWEQNLVTNEYIWDEEMSKIFNGMVYNDWSIESARAITHPDDLYIMDDLDAKVEKGQELIDFERRIILDGETKHIQVVARQIFGAKGQVVSRVGITRDITQDRLLLQQLENSLEEKNILIKEVHHRVKNNMQMISSILSLKSMDLTDPESKDIFDDCTTRIKSMAIVHDQLYRFYNVSEIDVSEYLDHLLSGLHSLMGRNAGNFIVKVDAEHYTMNVDQALLCGLIVSEMVANAFKHGFVDDKEGIVNVRFTTQEDSKVLSVTNTGSKIPKDILEMKTSSLGMSLIKTFAKQLEGKLSIHPDNGLQVKF